MSLHRFVVVLAGAYIALFCAPPATAAELATRHAVEADRTTFGALGLELGMTPAAVAAVLARDYRPCQADRSTYRATDAGAPLRLSALSINPGLAANDVGSAHFCSFSPAGDGITDSVEARFIHPDIDPQQPLYSITFKRLYPDAVFGLATVTKPLDALRKELTKSYGRPVDERRDTTPSAAANLARSIGIANKVRREDQRLRWLWTSDGGRLDDEEHEDSTCRCSSRYVKAAVEASRTLPAGKGKGRFHVTSVVISVGNPALAARQAEWNAQWLRK